MSATLGGYLRIRTHSATGTKEVKIVVLSCHSGLEFISVSSLSLFILPYTISVWYLGRKYTLLCLSFPFF